MEDKAPENYKMNGKRHPPSEHLWSESWALGEYEDVWLESSLMACSLDIDIWPQSETYFI